MHTNEHKLFLKEEVFSVVGCAMEVLNTLGHGFLEKNYENALVVEFNQRRIPYIQQPRYPVHYKEHKVGEFIPDLVAYEKLIIDTKVIPKITDHERGQILNYLKITNLKVGLLLNFKKPTLEWERIVN